jgi:hypothetical protein
MKTSKRVGISLLMGAIVLFVGLLFWPFIRTNILEPTAVALWLLLRILVLSIDQKYFWYAPIFLAVIFLFRLLHQESPSIQEAAHSDTNTTILNIGYWRVLFTYSDQDVRDEKILKRELMRLLTSLYASKQSTSNDFHVYEALQGGKIPLPENIHTFLFPAESQESGGPIKRLLQSIQKTLRKWIRQWTGREKAEYYRMIDEVLDFVETSLEIKNDDRTFTHNEH